MVMRKTLHRAARRIQVFVPLIAVLLSTAGPGAVATVAAAPATPQPKSEAGLISPGIDSASTAPAAIRIDHGARLNHAAGTASTPVSSARPSSAAAAALLANFDGTSSLDSAVTNFGAEFEPPDQGLCAGNGLVVDMVNSAYRVYDTAGNTLAGPFNINKPFHEGFRQFTSDPRCHFDAATNTWFAVILFLNNAFTASELDIAVASDPTKDWTVFRISTTDKNGAACPCFGDQPTLGIDSSNIYVTTNEFPIANVPGYNGAQIYAISKSDLVARSHTTHFVHYSNLSIGGKLAASVQPALTTGSAGAEYFLSSLDPRGTGDHRLGVWALTNTQAVGLGGMPRLSSLVIQSEPYAIPPPAQQKGATSTLDSDDDRMQQVQFIGGEIWGALGTSLKPTGDTMKRAAAAWFRVSPTLGGSTLASANITGQGYVQSNGEYVINPAIQADANGHAVVGFTLTSANRFPSAAYAVLGSSSTFGSPIVAAAGTGPYDPLATRWGDYSWAVLDPSGTSVWMATEYIPAPSRQTTDGKRNWGTRVFQVSLS
jgi:hypothetical protein